MPTPEAISAVPVTEMPTITLVSQDARGEIYSISLPGDRELMLLHSKAGSLRGGHSHNVPEQVMVLTGRMIYHKKGGSFGAAPNGARASRHDPNTHFKVYLREGRWSRNEVGRIHMGEFPEDTWLVEWKLARKGEWTQENYDPWRALVEANARA